MLNHITQAHVATALILMFILACLLSYTIGASLAKAKMRAALSYAAQSGENFKLDNRAHKIVLTSNYLQLCKDAERGCNWDWQYAGGKQR